jgi:hypothetical protein
VGSLLWHVFTWSAWAQSGTVGAGTTGEGAALASVRLVGVDSASKFDGGQYWNGHCSGLCSLSRRGIRQPLWWRERHLRAQLWPLFARAARAQPAYVLADTKGEGAPLAYVLSLGVGSCSPCGVGTTDEVVAWASVFSARTPLVAGRTGEGDSLTSIRSVCVVSARHFGGGHES